MRRIIIGKTDSGKHIYLDGGDITFPITWREHKILLDKMGKYYRFLPSRSGFEQFVIVRVSVENGKIVDTIEKLRKIQKDLKIKLFEYPKIKPKLDGLVLEAI